MTRKNIFQQPARARPALFLFLLSAFLFQTTFPQSFPARESAEWVRDAVIYEVYLRSFSPEGTFAGLEKRLPELKELGVTVLWLMPIHPVGAEKRKGTLGSPYAVRDYYAGNPEFGTLDDFRSLVGSIHREGMKIIIDLVINHTAWDNPLIKEHPEWYSKDKEGMIVAPNDDWTDVADLDYSQQGLRDYMMKVMEYWVREMGIDGFRCDVAELVPIDFWEEARRRLDSIRDVMMLSEGSLPEHHREAFDITYSWNIYDALLPLLTGKKPASALFDILRDESIRFPSGALRLRFNTNHDKNAWDAPAVKKFGMDGLQLTTVLVNTIPGVPLFYTGEEVANDRRLDLFEKVGVDWSRPRVIGQIAARLFELRKENAALTSGSFSPIPCPEDSSIAAFIRSAGEQKILVVLNFSEEQKSVDIPVAGLLSGEGPGGMKEVFTGGDLVVSSGWKVSLSIEGHGFRLFATFP